MEMVNGYVFLDLTKTNVYSKALKVLGTDKPVVIKDGSGSPYFVDSLTLDGTNVVITKGGKTITIANDNTITNVGDIQLHKYAIRMSLNNSSDGTGDNYGLRFQYDTYDVLTEYDNDTLTTEIANSIIPNYNGIICVDDDEETIQGFTDSKFTDSNSITLRPVGDLYITNDSKITITKIY